MNRTVDGLLRQIKSNPTNAGLIVYCNQSNDESSRGAWAIGDGCITLNLGSGKYSTISKETHSKIKDYLIVEKC